MLSSTWIASSRVGARMSARMGWRAGEVLVLAMGASFSMMGNAKPAVFPVPVCAAASTSCPASATGITASWIGDGSL